MAQLPELQAVRVTRADFLYLTVNENMWERLPSPNDNLEHNCYGVEFNDGVILTQSDHHAGSICRLKLILKSPLLRLRHNRLTIDAKCVEVQKPSFNAGFHSLDKVKAIEHAKTLPLASLSSNITTVRLRRFSELDHNGNEFTYDRILRNRIRNLIDRGYRAYVDAAQVINGSELKPRAPPTPEPCNSSSNVSSYEPQTEEQQSTLQAMATPIATPKRPSSSSSIIYVCNEDKHSQEELMNRGYRRRAHTDPAQMLKKNRGFDLWIPPPPQPCNSSSNDSLNLIKSEEERSTPQVTPPPPPPPSWAAFYPHLTGDMHAMVEQMKADSEERLRRDLKGEKFKVLVAVSTAIDGEWDRKVAAAMAEYRARAAVEAERIGAEAYDVLGWCLDGWAQERFDVLVFLPEIKAVLRTDLEDLFR